MVLRIDPNSAVAYSDLGEILRKRGQLEEAIAHFRKALALQPDFAEARANLEAALKTRNNASPPP